MRTTVSSLKDVLGSLMPDEIRHLRPHRRRGRAARPALRRAAAIAEAYDRAGFYGYHVAEHHTTPLGAAASPALIFAALSQRTKKLRFGPLVYLLPFYHPLRLIEEVCMIDQMSGGRFQLGVGRGVSMYETAAYALDFAKTGDVSRGVPGAAQGPDLGRADVRRRVLQVRQAADDPEAGAEAASAAVVRRHVPENAAWPAENDVNIVALGLRDNTRHHRGYPRCAPSAARPRRTAR